MNGIGERSCEPITPADLDRLAAVAAADREARFTRRPRWSVSGDRIICVAPHAPGRCGGHLAPCSALLVFARKRASASLGVRRPLRTTRRRATSPESWHPMHRHEVAARELSIRRARYRIEAQAAVGHVPRWLPPRPKQHCLRAGHRQGGRPRARLTETVASRGAGQAAGLVSQLRSHNRLHQSDSSNSAGVGKRPRAEPGRRPN